MSEREHVGLTNETIADSTTQYTDMLYHMFSVCVCVKKEGIKYRCGVVFVFLLISCLQLVGFCCKLLCIE